MDNTEFEKPSENLANIYSEQINCLLENRTKREGEERKKSILETDDFRQKQIEPLDRLTPPIIMDFVEETTDLDSFEVVDQAYLIAKLDLLFYREEKKWMPEGEAMPKDIEDSHNRTVRGSIERLAEEIEEKPEEIDWSSWDKQMWALYQEEKPLRDHQDYLIILKRLKDSQAHLERLEVLLSQDQRSKLDADVLKCFKQYYDFIHPQGVEDYQEEDKTEDEG